MFKKFWGGFTFFAVAMSRQSVNAINNPGTNSLSFSHENFISPQNQARDLLKAAVNLRNINGYNFKIEADLKMDEALKILGPKYEGLRHLINVGRISTDQELEHYFSMYTQYFLEDKAVENLLYLEQGPAYKMG